jgi:hypothetical protein
MGGATIRGRVTINEGVTIKGRRLAKRASELRA